VLPAFQSRLPAAIELKVFYDRSVSIRESIDDVQFTLILAGFLVILVILLFLRNLSATLIPRLALPISVIGTFAAMYAFGYSLDNLSLLALTLSVGFVVDDAIVMLENIVRHVERGETPFEAAIKGAREIGFTIISMTLSLIAVFIPVLFMGGIVGRLLHEFAVTICAAILVSGFVSLTLTPMLAAATSRTPIRQHGRTFLAFRALLRCPAGRLPSRPDLGHGAPADGAGEFPGDPARRDCCIRDAQGLPAQRRLRPDHRLHRRVRRTSPSRRWCSGSARGRNRRQDPEISTFMSFVGAGGVPADPTPAPWFNLKPHDERPESPDEIIAPASQAGCRAGHQGLPAEPAAHPDRRAAHQPRSTSTRCRTPTCRALPLDRHPARWRLRELPGFVDVNTNLNQSPVITLDIDRDKLARSA
jgi:HAE1 family hydrophobic/amphiphilic exporter-1